MELVAEHKEKHGLTRCLSALGLARSTWYYRRHRPERGERDSELKRQLIAVIKQHPEYGYRRLLPELVERTGRPLNHKRLPRVLKEHELGHMRCLPKHHRVRSDPDAASGRSSRKGDSTSSGVRSHANC